jgi:hypothetical protein
LEHHKTKDKIINFILNSPEEANSKVAIFIAGMHAQKNLTGYRRKTGRCSFIASRDGVSIVKK